MENGVFEMHSTWKTAKLYFLIIKLKAFKHKRQTSTCN